MLGRLVADKMRREGISSRVAAKRAGVSHTTITRAINGAQLDLKTVLLLCKWIGVSPASVIGDEEPDVIKTFAAIVGQNPKLSDVLDEAVQRYKDGEIDLGVVEDLVSYIAFRLWQKE